MVSVIFYTRERATKSNYYKGTENTGFVALRVPYVKYSNDLSVLAFFLDLFHLTFAYKFIVCPETTCFMQFVG